MLLRENRGEICVTCFRITLRLVAKLPPPPESDVTGGRGTLHAGGRASTLTWKKVNITLKNIYHLTVERCCEREHKELERDLEILGGSTPLIPEKPIRVAC